MRGHVHNNNHFTGKRKSPIKGCRKRVVRSKQEPHKNKYSDCIEKIIYV